MDETKTINPFLDDALDFDTIYDRYFDRVFQFTLYRVGNREVAKDLASDIFLKIWKDSPIFTLLTIPMRKMTLWLNAPTGSLPIFRLQNTKGKMLL